VDAGPEADRQSSVASPRASTDLPLVLYALAAAILIVSGYTLLARAGRQWNPFVDAIWLLAAAVFTVVAGLSADSVLGWLYPPRPSSDSSERS
jgi:hypothetical protein